MKHKIRDYPATGPPRKRLSIENVDGPTHFKNRSAEGSFRTRRGVEKTLFQFTIGLGVVFVLLSMLSVFLL